MSNYMEVTRHPKTGKEELAEWLDDYFGHRQYGVRFPDGKVFSLAEIDPQTEENPKFGASPVK